MERFIKAHPEVVIAVGGMCILLLGFLLTYPLYSINDSIEQIRLDMQNVVREIKDDRKEDRRELFAIANRVTKIESVCDQLIKRDPALNK